MLLQPPLNNSLLEFKQPVLKVFQAPMQVKL
jgi:hypothetical protein